MICAPISSSERDARHRPIRRTDRHEHRRLGMPWFSVVPLRA
jgi:hypothetical protein